jgi:hypothetical protein
VNGQVSVWCKDHRRRVRRDGAIAYHVASKTRCDSTFFLVRRERQVGLQGALHELMMIERAA